MEGTLQVSNESHEPAMLSSSGPPPHKTNRSPMGPREGVLVEKEQLHPNDTRGEGGERGGGAGGGGKRGLWGKKFFFKKE